MLFVSTETMFPDTDLSSFLAHVYTTYATTALWLLACFCSASFFSWGKST